jgi:hypothetical protein
MGKLRSRPPANDTRPTRRSLVELTAAASRAVDAGLLVMPASPVVIAPDNQPRAEDEANAAQTAAPSKQAAAVPVAEPAGETSPRRAAAPDCGSTAEMLAEIAKDYQGRALESIRLGFSAALDYAKDRAGTPKADRRQQDGGARSEDNLLAAVGAAAEYRVEALELVRANLATTVDYACELAGARTSAEFVELSSALARKQCELMLKQSAMLQSYARTMTKSGDREDG